MVTDAAVATATLFLGTIVVMGVAGPFIWTTDPLAINLAETLKGPSAEHPMGTDSIGRDVLARFNEGAQISLVVGAAVVGSGAVLGTAVGLFAGMLGRWVDATLMRVMDAILAFPSLMLAMAVTVGLGTGLTTAAIGIMITSIPFYARVTRVEVLRIRSLPFVEGAVAIGASRPRVTFRHIIPHVVTSVTILAAANFGYVVLTLAALGFVGLGAQIPSPEWGAMITEGQQFILTGAWWIAFFPGLGLLLVATAANVVADKLRDVLDPARSGAASGGV